MWCCLLWYYAVLCVETLIIKPLLTPQDVKCTLQVILLCHVKNISSKLQTSSEWHSLRKLINEASLDKLLSNIEDVPLVASCLANMSVSMTNVQDELQSMFQAFNKQLQENENVLVISLGISTIECPGMVQEEKVCILSDMCADRLPLL